MRTNVNNNRSPLDAFIHLMGTSVHEAGRAAGELGQRAVEDIDSVSNAIETGGFLAGALQFLDIASPGRAVANIADAATGKGDLDPRVKEGISAAANYFAANPIFYKDLFDLFTAPSQPGVRPAPPHMVPAPTVDRPAGESGPPAPGHEGRTGYAESPAPPRTTQEVSVVVVDNVSELQEILTALRQAKTDPLIETRYPDIHAILNDENATLGEISLVVTANVLRDQPEVLNDPALDPVIQEVRENVTMSMEPPEASTGAGDFSQVGQQAMSLLGQLAGPLGMGMQLFGAVLSHPMVSSFLAPLLVQGLNALVPGLGVALAPILPVALPIAGQLLSMGGSMMQGASGGIGGAPAGMTPDAVGGLLGGLSGAFGGAPMAAVPQAAPAA